MLTEEELQKVRLVLASSGWNDVMRPRLENRARNAIKALVLNRAERTAMYPGQDFDADDGDLRAMIRACEWMIAVWPNEILAAEHNRRRDELDRQNMDAGAMSANPS